MTNGTPTLRLSTWPAPPDDPPEALRHAQRSSGARRRWPFVVFGLLGAVWFALALPKAPAEPELATPPVAQVTTPSAPTAPLAPTPVAQSIAAEAPAPTPPGTADGAEEIEAPAAPLVSENAKLLQRVTLEVFPADAKVVRKGMRQPGPPYTFKLPPGSRVAVEVAKKGFVTRRVVLDGSEPTVTVGLRRASSRRRPEPSPAPKSASHDESSSRVGSGL